MISVDLAQDLKRAGLRWRPAAGDRFVLPGRDMDEDVFTLAEMTVEVHDHPSGRVIGFNGTTEWALDSVDEPDALWMPAEHQLRELLGERFTRLERRDVGTGQLFRVIVLDEHGGEVFEDADAACAYARALLRQLRGSSRPSDDERASSTAA
ncbi:pilus assembly protein CpaE [Kineococcus glutinatus]|uniref:Pilus assembly protein CpaE n=1 Tax=Kineococcus glutinatus TaxID=1070872 RepID=A0ABP9HLH5_9ACTN